MGHQIFNSGGGALLPAIVAFTPPGDSARDLIGAPADHAITAPQVRHSTPNEHI